MSSNEISTCFKAIEIENKDKDKSGSNIHDKIKKIPAIGIIFSMISAFFFATGTLIVKLLEDIEPLAIFSHRCLIQLIVYGIVIIILKENPLKNNGEYIGLLERTVYGFFCISAVYYSFRLMPLGDASAIIFASPAFASVLAYFFLGEAFGLPQCVTLILVIAGSIFICKPPMLFGSDPRDGNYDFSDTHFLGFIVAFIGCIFNALSMISIRKLKKSSSSVIIFWYSLGTVIVGYMLTFILNLSYLPDNLRDTLLLIGIGLCGVCGQFFITYALKLESAGPVSVARSFDVLISFVYQIAITHEPIEWNSALGSLLIVSGVVLLVVLKCQCKLHIFKHFIISKKHNTLNDTKVNNISQNISGPTEPENII